MSQTLSGDRPAPVPPPVPRRTAPPPPPVVAKAPVSKRPPPPTNPRTPATSAAAAPPRPAGPPPKPAAPVEWIELDWDDEDEKTTMYEKEATRAALNALETASFRSVVTDALSANVVITDLPMPGEVVAEAPTAEVVEAAAAMVELAPPVAAQVPSVVVDAPAVVVDAPSVIVETAPVAFVPLPRPSPPPPREVPPVVPPMGILPPPSLPPMTRQAITEPPISGSYAAADLTLPRPAILPSDISDILPTEMLPASTARRRRPFAAVAGAVLAVAAAAAFLLQPHNGNVVIAAKSAGRTLTAGHVFVDGKPVCDALPCRAPGIERGTRTVRVDVPGYETGAELIQVHAGEDTAITVELVREGAQPETSLTAAAVAKPASKPKATLLLDTQGSTVTLVSGGQRTAVSSFPFTVEVDPAKPLTIEATKAGYADFRQPVAVEAGQTEKTFHIALTEEKPASSGTPDRASSSASAAKADVKAAPAAKGQLSLDSSPPSKVVLDGRPLGSTPKAGIAVSAGAHTVLFANPGGSRKSVTVWVKAGETRSVSVKLGH